MIHLARTAVVLLALTAPYFLLRGEHKAQADKRQRNDEPNKNRDHGGSLSLGWHRRNTNHLEFDVPLRVRLWRRGKLTDQDAAGQAVAIEEQLRAKDAWQTRPE